MLVRERGEVYWCVERVVVFGLAEVLGGPHLLGRGRGIWICSCL